MRDTEPVEDNRAANLACKRKDGFAAPIAAIAAAPAGIAVISFDRNELREIFDLYGQAAYRRAEKRALEAVIDRHERAVIATGGSLVSEPATFDFLLSACFTVWLKARPEEHMSRVFAQGDMRPMAASEEAMADLRRILAGRNALYAKADATIDTSAKTVETSMRELMTAVGG